MTLKEIAKYLHDECHGLEPGGSKNFTINPPIDPLFDHPILQIELAMPQKDLSLAFCNNVITIARLNPE